MKYLILSLTMFAASCSKSEHPTEYLARDATPCVPQETEGGVNLVCPTESVFLADGEDGIDGEGSCSLKVVDKELVAVCDGQTIPLTNQVTQGPQGPKGDKGEPGKNGTNYIIYEDEAKCLWIENTETKQRWKLRHPL